MNDHYYSRTQNVTSNPRYWNVKIKDYSFRFKTDSGVFSKSEVDFGSRVLLEKFELPETKGPLLDVGCGYGPIGLTLAKLCPDAEVHMVDVNQRALSLAEENAELNQITNVKIYESDRLLGVSGRRFAAIITNPPIRAGKRIVHDIFLQAVDHLLPNGQLWVVIQKKQGAPSAIKRLEELYENVEVVGKEKGYFVIRASKKQLT